MLAVFLPITSSSHFNIFYLMENYILCTTHGMLMLLLTTDPDLFGPALDGSVFFTFNPSGVAMARNFIKVKSRFEKSWWTELRWPILNFIFPESTCSGASKISNDFFFTGFGLNCPPAWCACHTHFLSLFSVLILYFHKFINSYSNKYSSLSQCSSN
jgi:hypothetical protein